MKLALVGSAGFALPLSGCKEAEQEESVEAPEEIILGNVRFHFDEGSNYVPSEREKIMKLVKKSYERLVAYFGNEVVEYSGGLLECPIRRNMQSPRAGEVVYSIDGAPAPDRNGNLMTAERPKLLSLQINDIYERIVLHELVHLFLQPEIANSKAFNEGHAHLVTEVLLGDNPLKEQLTLVEQNEHLSRLLDIGLDYSEAEVLTGGGIREADMVMMAEAKWTHEWQQYLKIDPDFLKQFYKKIAELRAQRMTSFTKEDLIAVAEVVSVGFTEWHEKVPSFQKIGSVRGARFEGILTRDNVLLTLNLRPFPRRVVHGRLVPPVLGSFPGAQILEIVEKDGAVRKTMLFTLQFMNVQELALKEGESVRVQVGGRNLPIKRL